MREVEVYASKIEIDDVVRVMTLDSKWSDERVIGSRLVWKPMYAFGVEAGYFACLVQTERRELIYSGSERVKVMIP